MKTKMLYKKTRKTLFMSILIFILTSFLMCTNVFAFTCSVCNEEHKKLTGTKGVAFNLYADLFSGNIFHSENAGGVLTTEDILRFDVNNSNFSTMFSQAESLYNAIKVFGELMCIIYTMLKIIEHFTADNLNPEKLVLLLIKMIIGIIAIRSGFDMIMAGLTLANVAFNNLAGASFSNASTTTCLYADISKADFWNALGYILKWALPSFSMTIVKFIVSIICWMRLLDILVRIIFAPIGMSNIIQDGIHGSGFGYLKKLISSSLQGAVILGLVRGYGIIVGMLPGGSFITKLILAFSLLSVLFKSSQIAEDVMAA